MYHPITTQTIGTTKFTDISDKTHTVNHSVILSEQQRKEHEEQIVEELYRIFTHKAG